MIYDLQKKYKEEVIPEMKKSLGYKNNMAIPKIEKVVVGSGVGSAKDDDTRELIGKNLALITGQAPVKCLAKKSIASFKLRQGGHVGYRVTLRGQKMYDFLNRTVYISIPRKRDFRGIDPAVVDNLGNMTLGFKEHLVFPEMAGGDIKNLFGLGVTIVTTAKNKKEALELFRLLGFPFTKK